ncbi:MAG TPA: hypothetical protein VJR89_19065 [Polyangiales bacterium]|nr:hypothetical protein [Polyangiales bacterium]
MDAVSAANRLRYARGTAGHVESHFVKANSPDGERALWIKHTLLAPAAQPEAAVVEVWAVAFAERGARKVAAKRSFPIAELEALEPFGLRVSCAELIGTRARGQLDGLAWELELEPQAPPFKPFALERMYSGAFPRSKSLTPIPDARVSGHFAAFGERWELSGWRGAQGHNWGVSHAHAYAWAHANSWRSAAGSGEVERGVWFEALTGKVRIGPLTTPWLSVAGFAWNGRLYRFDGLRALTSRRVDIDPRSYRIELRQGGARLRAEFRAETERIAGLCYSDPDGSLLACLNSKLASGTLEFSDGARGISLRTEQAALEIGTRLSDHGIAFLA